MFLGRSPLEPPILKWEPKPGGCWSSRAKLTLVIFIRFMNGYWNKNRWDLYDILRFFRIQGHRTATCPVIPVCLCTDLYRQQHIHTRIIYTLRLRMCVCVSVITRWGDGLRAWDCHCGSTSKVGEILEVEHKGRTNHLEPPVSHVPIIARCIRITRHRSNHVMN